MPEPLIRNVSDTAHWVAFHRAVESERPDALFRDPFARRLAGSRGESIVGTKRFRNSEWSIVTRTVIIDAWILDAIARDGIQRVVNLASGLDTRPYRMALPPELLWIEADLPEISAYIESKIASEKPVCRLERVSCDLADSQQLQKLIEKLEADPRPTLVLTEGLLIYLKDSEVVRLAQALSSAKSIRLWMTDLLSPQIMQMLRRGYGNGLNSTGIHSGFAPAEGAKFFERYGWKEREWRSLFHESFRIQRTMRWGKFYRFLGSFQSPEKKEASKRMGGVLMMERT